MEGDPFAVVEAMTIAAFATGCEHGYLYVRGEYPLAFERMQHAIDRRSTASAAWREHPRGAAVVRDRDSARRRRVHLRRGDRALRIDRGQARRAAQQAAVPRAAPGSSASRPSSTTSRRSPTFHASSWRAARRSRPWARRSRPARVCFASRGARRSGPASTRRRSATTLRAVIEMAGGFAQAGRSKRCCSAAPRARLSGPTNSTCSSLTRTRARPGRRWDPAS